MVASPALSRLIRMVLPLTLLAAAGCALNPATGGMDFMLVSHDEEKEIGRQTHPDVLREFGGVYSDPTLSAYVEAVGRRIADMTEDQDFEYRFTVLDSPIVNAFALPGGYVYVTRGLLALIGSEAELAAALAHELAHINARHGAQRLSRMKAKERVCETLICAAGVPVLGDLASIGARLTFGGFTQDQEFEADQIGQRYLARAGYDTRAMASFLGRLSAERDLDARAAGLDGERAAARDYDTTHPLTAERIQKAAAQTGSSAGFTGEAEYLSKIDGMLYGNRREFGFVQGRRYLQPIRRITFEVPEGYALRTDSRGVAAIGPDGAAILFEPSRQLFAGPLEAYLGTVWAEGVELRDVRRLNINGMEAATGWVRGQTAEGPIDFRLVAARAETGVIFRFLFMASAPMTDRQSADMRRTTYSLRRLSPVEAEALRPLHVRIVTANTGDDIAALAARGAPIDDAVARLAIMNGVNTEHPVVEPGQLIKVIAE